uniref:Uncharacterized protein n=1 Tax=Anguilla anguilla TaxID=7936 RepID=A0A0E9W6P9_ANGAN
MLILCPHCELTVELCQNVNLVLSIRCPSLKCITSCKPFTCLPVFVQEHNLPPVYPILASTIRTLSLKTL